MLDLHKIFKNPVTLLKTDYNEENFLKLPRMFGGKNIIYSVLDEEDICQKFSKKEEKLFFVTPAEIIKILHQNLKSKIDEVDCCSIIIINNIHTNCNDKLLAINLWKEIFKTTKRRPYLIITSFSEYIPELPFKFKKDQLQNMTTTKEIVIEYYENSFTPVSKKIAKTLANVIIYKHKNYPIENNNIWLVFYCGNENLIEELNSKIGKEVNIYKGEALKKTTKFFSDKKRNVIILDNDYIPSVFVSNISGVFDSMISMNNGINYSTKQISEIRSSYQENGFVFRLCAEEYYKSLPKITPRLISERLMSKRYIEMIDLEIDLNFLFLNIVSEEKLQKDIEKLEIFGAIMNNKMTDIGEIILELPLKTENCVFLYHWIKEKNLIFSGIIAAVLSEIETPFYLEGENTFEGYLKKMDEILREEKTLSSLDYRQISEKYGVELDAVREIFNKIIKIVKILRKKHNFELGTYDSKILVKLLIPYYEKSYLDETFKLIDRRKLLYKNKNDIYKLDDSIFNFDISDPPPRIFSFQKGNFNYDDSSYQRNKKLIYYFF
jgi:hypothetical protein